MSDSNSRLVYSTETGRIDEAKPAPVRPKGDGIVRIQRQTSGRKGKVRDATLSADALEQNQKLIADGEAELLLPLRS